MNMPLNGSWGDIYDMNAVLPLYEGNEGDAEDADHLFGVAMGDFV